MHAGQVIAYGRTVVGSERKTCPDYDSDDADVELVSSDNVLFKVHSFTLQHGSLVFRSMIAMASSTAQRNAITLTDNRFENSLVFKIVLDITYSLDIGKQKTDQDMYLLRYVVDFAKRWEMEIVIKTNQKEMWRRIDSKSEDSDLLRHFLITLALGNNKLAASCYKSSKIKSSIPSSVQSVEPSTEEDSESDTELESQSPNPPSRVTI